MSVLTVHDRGGYLCFDEAECRAAGAARAEDYAAASPFPHIAIDGLIDAGLLRELLAGFPARDGKAMFDRDQERLKAQYAPHEIADRRLRNFLMELNGAAFLGFLEELTGITGLIPDPHFIGGGLHETLRGGHLGVHADFNIHRQMQVERRLNLLIYLNDDWPANYGGDLELWNGDMTACAARIAPLMARAVIFNTRLDSFHGHPDPLACPPDRSRRSIATYYYTAPEDGVAALRRRTTLFRARPGSPDRADRRTALDHFIRDWVPARLQPLARCFNRFR